MLLNVAADRIAAHLIELRDVLGPKGLWRLLGEAFDSRDTPHFEQFWKSLSAATAGANIVWSARCTWIAPQSSRIPPAETTADEEQSLLTIGVQLVHGDIRPYQNALQALGARRFAFANLIDALEIWDRAQPQHDGPEAKHTLQPLWQLTDRLIPGDAGTNKTTATLVDRLEKIHFIPQWPNGFCAIDDLYRLPNGLTNEQISR